MKVLYWKNPLVLAYRFFVRKIILSFVVFGFLFVGILNTTI